MRPIHVYPWGSVWYSQPTLQIWKCVSVHVCMHVYKRKHIGSHVDTFKNIHGKLSYSGDVHCLGPFKSIHLPVHTYRSTYITYLRVFFQACMHPYKLWHTNVQNAWSLLMSGAIGQYHAWWRWGFTQTDSACQISHFPLVCLWSQQALWSGG